MMEKTPDQMTPEEALKYYQEAYQKEKKSYRAESSYRHGRSDTLL